MQKPKGYDLEKRKSYRKSRYEKARCRFYGRAYDKYWTDSEQFTKDTFISSMSTIRRDTAGNFTKRLFDSPIRFNKIGVTE